MKEDAKRVDTAGDGAPERLDSRVIPVMREAVATVQLVLFGRLKDKLAERYLALEREELSRMVGCVVNDLFGTPAQDRESSVFAREHFELVEKELWALAENMPEMLPLLTDALRMQTLCDQEEGINSLPTLLRARSLGVLQEERTVPMPSTFMLAVRRLGAESGLLKPMQVRDPGGE